MRNTQCKEGSVHAGPHLLYMAGTCETKSTGMQLLRFEKGAAFRIVVIQKGLNYWWCIRLVPVLVDPTLNPVEQSLRDLLGVL